MDACLVDVEGSVVLCVVCLHTGTWAAWASLHNGSGVVLVTSQVCIPVMCLWHVARNDSLQMVLREGIETVSLDTFAPYVGEAFAW